MSVIKCPVLTVTQTHSDKCCSQIYLVTLLLMSKDTDVCSDTNYLLINLYFGSMRKKN